jgi:hypothetical protein
MAQCNESAATIYFEQIQNAEKEFTHYIWTALDASNY